MTCRVPPGEGPGVAGRTSPSGKKRIRDLFDSRTDSVPKGQKLVFGIAGSRKGEGTEEFNPMIFDKRVNKPPGNERNRGRRKGRKNRNSKGKGCMVRIPSIQEGNITGELDGPTKEFCRVDCHQVDHRGTRL